MAAPIEILYHNYTAVSSRLHVSYVTFQGARRSFAELSGMQMRTAGHQTNLRELDKTEHMCQNDDENIVKTGRILAHSQGQNS